MFINIWEQIINNLYQNLIWKIEFYAPKLIWAVSILLMGLIISVLMYRSIMYLFKKFKIKDIIDRLELKMDLNLWKDSEETIDDKKLKIRKTKRKKLTEKINVDIITSKAFSYYVFLMFFRLSIVAMWFTQIEVFLNDVLSYLPNLFIAVCVWFFWVRFSDTVYDIVYYTLEITKHQTSKIIAMGAKVIILFFTIMVVLDQVKIVSEFIINTIFVWFISTITIWAWIALWLWGKDVAREILESFKK